MENDKEESMFKAKKESIAPFPSHMRIQEFQQNYEVQLPSDFIEFLMKYNGAVPDKGEFNCNGHAYFIERFFCLLDNEIFHSREDLAWLDMDAVIMQFEDLIIEDLDSDGMELVPIALLFAGDMVCLDFRVNPLHPNICVWDSEKSEDLSPVTYKAADSFTEFLNMLY